MAKKPTNVYNLADVIEREMAKRNNYVAITAGEETFNVPKATIWPDAVLDALENERLLTAAKLLLGDRYDAFVAAGGSSTILLTILKDDAGAELPES